MRKIIVLEFLSLDGVMQAPGGPQEDTSVGFDFGGWTVPYMDEFSNTVMTEQMAQPFDLLLGKKTYDIWAAYWPNQDNTNPIAALFNKVKKYVVTHNSFQPSWESTIVLTSSDVALQIKNLKNEDGPDLQVYGSGNLVQTLLKHDLVDELWLKIFPVTLGSGKRLFAEGTLPAAYQLIEAKISPIGVIFANYKRDGEVRTGSFV